jgi:hypothetical protein
MKIGIKEELWNRGIQAFFVLGTLLSIVWGVSDIMETKPNGEKYSYLPWIVLAIFIALESGRTSAWRVIQRYDAQPHDRERASVYKFFFYGNRIVIFIFLLAGVWAAVTISIYNEAGTLYVYQTLGVVVLILWGVVFLSYFIWAIYFYNVNYGLPEEEWDKINDEKKKLANGLPYTQEILDDEPKYNPYQDQTFGLPPGTVRGMIAFTLLFGALCILFVRIGVKNEIDAGTVVWDQHEFFNNAFLMMIAFYFGSRSLEILTDKKKKATENTDPTNTDNNTDTNNTKKTDSTTTTDDQQQAANAPQPKAPEETIEQETDPMTGKKL